MSPDSAVPQPEQVAAFFQKHRTGLVTVVFTDLVDSTALLHRLGDQAGATFLRRRRQILREVLHSLSEAEEIETAGDSFLLVFAKPSDAVRFALQSQARLRTFSAESKLPVLERMGIHLGEVVISEHETKAKTKDLYGIQLAACARVMSLAVGGQVLLTRGAFDSARQVLKGEDIPGVGALEWVSHGPYLLKGIEEPVEVCEVAETSEGELVAPKTSEKAQRQVRPDEESVLGWRPAVGQEVPNTRWVLEKKLGEGGFGEVWLGRHQTMKERRVFKFCFRADRVRSLKREMTLFRLIKERIGDHPNIVALREVYLEQPPFYVEEDYVAGEDLASWCQSQGGVEKVPLTVKLEVVVQIAEALQAAHETGVIHRDVKPANILVRGSSRGHEALASSAGTTAKSEPAQVSGHEVVAKLTDFGIGQVVSQEYLAGVTKAGFTETMLGSTSSQTGTQLYMAPELLAGKAASPQSDIFSLGAVLYQLLVGDFHRPLTIDGLHLIDDPLLREDLTRCFAGRPEERFASAQLLAKSLRSIDQRRAEFTRTRAAEAARKRAATHWQRVRAVGVAVLVLGLGASLIWYAKQGAKVRWARETALPEITRLAKEGKNTEAFALAEQAEKYIPSDPALTNLCSQISVRAIIETTPSGADVYLKEYRKPESPWRYIGKSPLKDFRIPRGFYRWQMKKQGNALTERAAYALPEPEFPWLGSKNSFSLAEANLPPGMVRIDGGETGLLLTGMDDMNRVRLESFLIDKYEVSNRQFKDFVEASGYAKSNYWKQPFVKQGQSLTWSEAVGEFRDSSGQPGPATWKNGTYPEGEADYPVRGISWYEAAAYAEFAGKRLPSVYHWHLAATIGEAPFIVPLSNFSSRGPAHAGTYHGMSGWGVYDMAGNVKEWCWNEAGENKRYVLGGAWDEPDYMFTDPDAQSPFERRPTHGMRCIQLLATKALPKNVDDFVSAASRNYAVEQPATDEIYRIYKGQYAYDKVDLKAQVESIDDTSDFWRKEKISFDAGYGTERVTAFLFLPKKLTPPFQAVVYFPGAGALFQRSCDNLEFKSIDFIVGSGRAVIYPIYKGTYERGDGAKVDWPSTNIIYRDHVIQWSKDLGRSIDYLETRKEIRSDKISYYGVSWGAEKGALFPAVEERIKVNVLVGGGFNFQRSLPEVDQINFAPHVKQPTLMLNGRYDFFFPVETSQRHMFRLLGVSPEHKRHVLFETGHSVPREQLVQETLAWLDKYLGPVK
jgi:serine/threonine protein kinase/class 3 adenylate cyclase